MEMAISIPRHNSLTKFFGILDNKIRYQISQIRVMKENKQKLISLREATKYCDYSQGYSNLLARSGKIGRQKEYG